MSENRSLHSATLGSEEDTFKALRQAPFECAVNAWQVTTQSGQSEQCAIAAIRKLGWSYHEYCRIWNALYGN